jgi:CubicO group peptidase (beta-lactamase class C family)
LIFPRTLDEAQISQIDKVIQERMGTVKLNKFGIIIVNSTSIIHQKVFGEGITTKSRFPLASVTKSFTALGILKLDIPLNQTIDNYNLGNYIDEDLAKQITVEDLLTQSSGLDRNSRKQVGKKGDFIYSNYGYSLLGKIIEDQSKEKNYADFIKKNILDELNMTESGLDFVNDFIDSYDNFFGFLTKYNNLESDSIYRLDIYVQR